MRDEKADIELGGIVLTDVATGQLVDLGRLRGVALLTLIRHRF